MPAESIQEPRFMGVLSGFYFASRSARSRRFSTARLSTSIHFSTRNYEDYWYVFNLRTRNGTGPRFSSWAGLRYSSSDERRTERYEQMLGRCVHGAWCDAVSIGSDQDRFRPSG